MLPVCSAFVETSRWHLLLPALTVDYIFARLNSDRHRPAARLAGKSTYGCPELLMSAPRSVYLA